MNDDKKIQSHRDLNVWQLGIEIAEGVYAISRTFPKEKLYGLTSQIRRAAVSVPANIAEGNARSSTKEYLHLLSISVGSLAEVETHLELALRFQYADTSAVHKLESLIGEERRMLRGLQRALRNKLSR